MEMVRIGERITGYRNNKEGKQRETELKMGKKNKRI